LISHGIDTTIVEIDPVVRQYALEYFSLPEDHTPVITDAVKYASETTKYTKKQFDYIVHDVFTGGAEPVDLFTKEFLGDLHNLLKPNGAIAIVRLPYLSKISKNNVN
jgi:spermidine synthase